MAGNFSIADFLQKCAARDTEERGRCVSVHEVFKGCGWCGCTEDLAGCHRGNLKKQTLPLTLAHAYQYSQYVALHILGGGQSWHRRQQRPISR